MRGREVEKALGFRREWLNQPSREEESEEDASDDSDLVRGCERTPEDLYISGETSYIPATKGSGK